jgi:hypothetical protein
MDLNSGEDRPVAQVPHDFAADQTIGSVSRAL